LAHSQQTFPNQAAALLQPRNRVRAERDHQIASGLRADRALTGWPPAADLKTPMLIGKIKIEPGNSGY
jgi:hypothetical protein